MQMTLNEGRLHGDTTIWWKSICKWVIQQICFYIRMKGSFPVELWDLVLYEDNHEAWWFSSFAYRWKEEHIKSNYGLIKFAQGEKNDLKTKAKPQCFSSLSSLKPNFPHHSFAQLIILKPHTEEGNKNTSCKLTVYPHQLQPAMIYTGFKNLCALLSQLLRGKKQQFNLSFIALRSISRCF